MTYKRYKKIIIWSLVELIIHSRTSFIHKDSINKRLDSNRIFLGKPSPDFNTKIIFFWSYAIVYTGTTTIINRRSIPIISLRESNEDVGHFFMSMYTVKYIHSNDWVESHIDDEVVKRVEELAKIEKQPTFDQYTMFEWAPIIPILENMIGNEDKGSDEENPEDELVEEIVEEISEE